jgi:AcrR family transcriptional regulator
MDKVVGVTTQRRTEISTRRLLEAAAELIAEQGYEHTTLVAIGQRAGYSAGLVTQRFGSKDGLLHALVQRLTTDWATVQLDPQIGADSSLDGVTIMLEEIRESVGRDPGMVRALYSLMFEAVRIPALYDDMVKLHRSLRRRVTDAVVAARRQGQVRPDADPEAFARLVVSTLRGASYQWLLDPEFPFHETITDLVAIIRRDLAVSDVPTPSPEA